MASDPTQGYGFDLNSTKRIGRVVREVETNQQLPPTTNRRSRFNGPMVEGIMLENLDGTDDPNVPTKARMQIKTGLQANDEWKDDPQPSILTIWNRTTTSVSIDQVVFAKEVYPDRWHLIVGGGSGVVTSIRFEIVSSDPTTLTGLALILAWNYGFTQSQIPASILGNTVVEICDPKGCFLNEPNVDLTARQGTAVYRQGLPETVCRPGYPPFDGVWEVETLCCRLIECEVII